MKASNNPFPSVLVAEQGSAPATPASGYGRIYCKTDGLYFIGDNGIEVGPLAGSSSGTAASTDGWNTSSAMTYVSADDPTYTAFLSGNQTGTFSPGMRIKLTQATVKYFIVTSVVYSSGTSMTLYGGTDYDLANAAISNPYYSTHKAPYGFPLNPTMWTAEFNGASGTTQSSPTQNAWYNTDSISLSIPIGVWDVEYSAVPYVLDTSATQVRVFSTLSTANNSESDVDFTRVVTFQVGSSSLYGAMSVYARKTLNLGAKTSYYLNCRTTLASVDNITINGALARSIIRAVCAYL